MDTKNNDVDLEALLARAEESEEVDTSGASDQEATQKETVEETPEEVSARENERVRKLADDNRRLVEENEQLKKPVDGEWNDLDSFIDAIQDEPSKKLLKTYGDLMEKKFTARVSPVLNEHNETKFEKEFEVFASKAPSLNIYKEDIKKSFLRNPNQSVKALVGEVVMDNLASKIKPIERKGAEPRRGAPDISKSSKDELYDLLESKSLNY